MMCSTFQPSGRPAVRVLTNSGCPREGDETQGQEQVGSLKGTTKQQETSKTKGPDLVYTLSFGGEEFRPGQKYRRCVDRFDYGPRAYSTESQSN